MKRYVFYLPPALHARFEAWLAQQRVVRKDAPASLSDWCRRTMEKILSAK